VLSVLSTLCKLLSTMLKYKQGVTLTGRNTSGLPFVLPMVSYVA